MKLWSCTGFNQRLVESVYASDGSILDIKNIEVEDLTNQEFENIERINDNNNYEKTGIEYKMKYKVILVILTLI